MIETSPRRISSMYEWMHLCMKKSTGRKNVSLRCWLPWWSDWAKHCYPIQLMRWFTEPTFDDHFFIYIFTIPNYNLSVLDIRVTISIVNTILVLDLTFLIVILNRFQLQILFSNILYFSRFSGSFFELFWKIWPNRYRR